MKIWPILSFLPAILIGTYIGTFSNNSKKSVKTFVDMRMPADVDSDFVVNISKEIDLEEVGPGNFLFNASLSKDETSWGISSKSFYIQTDEKFLDVCDHLNNNDGFVNYKLVAEGVANSGDNIEIDVSMNCTDFDFVELFPFEFCDSNFTDFMNETYETEASNYNFINFSDFMPKNWYIKEVNFKYEDRESGELMKEAVLYNSADPIVISCFES